MIEHAHRNWNQVVAREPEARYAYYRRCQVFRRNGEQCKAPAEKGSYICHAHAGQLALAVRREQERRAVLAEAVAAMHRRGNAEYEMKDLFMDFKGIQVTLEKMAKALIDGRIDCKTAGRLVVQLQTASKLLRMVHRKERKENQISPQISIDERRLVKGKEPSALLVVPNSEKRIAEKDRAANQREETRMGSMSEVLAFTDIRGLAHGPPTSTRAA